MAKKPSSTPQALRQQVSRRGSASPDAVMFNECATIYKNGKYADSLAHAEIALGKFPRSAVLMNVAAASAQALGNAEKAEQFWRLAISVQPDWPDPYSNLGNLLRETKRFEDAEAIYHQALSVRPDYPYAYNNLGTLYEATQRSIEAEAAYRKALEILPEFAEALVNLGRLLQRTDRIVEAEELYRRALQLFPKMLEPYVALAGILQATSRIEEAESLYRQALAVRPGSLDAYVNLGNLLHQLRRNAEAEGIYRQALSHHPNAVAVYSNLSMLLKDVRRYEEAEAAVRRALELSPGFAGAYNNLGILLNEMKRFDEAGDAFQKALLLEPNNLLAYNNYGNLLLATKRLKDAEEIFKKALTINPNFVAVLNNLGNLYHHMQQFDEAGACFKKAAEIQPDFAEAYNNLGSVQQDLKQFEAAEKSFRQAIRLNPDYGNAAGQAYLCARSICDWAHIKDDEAMLAAMVGRQIAGVPVFNLLSVAAPSGMSAPSLLRKAAYLFAEKKYFELALPPVVSPESHLQRQQLRIGYISADFHEHATMYLLQGVLAAHDRTAFVLYGYSYGPTSDVVTKKAAECFDVFRELRGLSSTAAAAVIAADGVDILVDLKGFTGNARPEITALRPAPVIVNWLGYPGTLGHPRLADYIIGDAVVSPLEHAADFSETLALMPHCYQPNDDKRHIGAVPSRAAAGLPDTGFIFCSFNQSYKFGPEMFDTWCALLKDVPESVLWLLSPSEAAINSLRLKARDKGISSDRLIFAPPLPLPDHLARLQLADLALDTFPVTSHTTASDALWAGVPLVTRMGDSFVSRVAASLLRTVGLPELVSDSQESYYALARALATDAVRLREIRLRLSELRYTSPLFDTAKFARDLESVFVKIWDQHSRGVREPIIIADGAEISENGTPVVSAGAIQPIKTVATTLPKTLGHLNITRVFNPDYKHNGVLDDVASALHSALKDIGCNVTVSENILATDAYNILIGAHLLGSGALAALPANVIIYNFEQISDGSRWMEDDYLGRIAVHRVWDYSERNVQALKQRFPGIAVSYVPLAYAESLTRLQPVVEDIDVLFYGQMSPRRLVIINALRAAGVKVFVGNSDVGADQDIDNLVLDPVYGRALDELVQRAKIVLNVHYYDSQILEAVRISYLLSNRKAVVSECSAQTEVYPHWRDGLCLVGYDQLVSNCLRLLQDENSRHALGERGLVAVKNLKFSDVIAPVVQQLFNPTLPVQKSTVPLRLNLGSGKDWREDFFNLDVLERARPDWNANICQQLAFGSRIESERFATFDLRPGYFNLIIANDVLEHLPDLVQAMTNCLSLLSVGGEMHIQVPYDLSYGAWQDPTHVRAFNENSWLYYTDWYWYLGWKTERFVMLSQEFLLSPLGEQLIKSGITEEEVRRTPRAVDSLRVVLRKNGVE